MVLFITFGFTSVAQSEKKLDKLFADAKSYYSSQNLEATIATCNRILAEAPGYVNAHLLLADLYNKIDSLNLEILHLSKAEELSNDTLVFFRLGEAYYEMGDYSEALRYYNKYSNYKLIPEKRQFVLACKIASCKFAINSIKNPVEFDPTDVGEGVNSVNDEYWPTPSLDGKKLVFTRLLKGSGYPQEDFFVSEKDSENWSSAKPLYEINTGENEGAQTLSADSKILFFTACNRPEGFGSCDIYFSRFQNGKWSNPENAGSPLNTNYWEAQPSFSSDNKYLYFSSNRKGGKGKKDIWRAEFMGFSETGKPRWKEPENMGSAINTAGDEISPFIHANNHNFYFASDGLTGMGGLDLFTAEIDENGKIDSVKNMGYPINTHQDELGLTISSIGETAYFSSARNSETGLDIFSFNLDRGLRPTPVSYIKAKITDKQTGGPVQADVDFADLSYSVPKNRVETADRDGEIMLCLPLSRNYSFTVSEPGYLFYSRSILLKDAKTLVDPLVLDIKLDPIEVGAQMNLYNIYFETDSFRILPASEPELERLMSFLKTNPNLKVEIQGHTDNTGTTERNQLLSEQRAKSVVDYLVNKGIQATRLHFKGYGENVPVANNDTEQGRTLNRRTTVLISGK
ncbi:MAG: OmpA family protein [Draconibacterium sp.]